MATSPDLIRSHLAVVTGYAVADLEGVAAAVPLERSVQAILEATQTVVPAYYDATGELAAAWYDELRDEANPRTVYTPTIIGDPETDWIEREVGRYARELRDVDGETLQLMLAREALRLAEKEVARGFRDTTVGNTRMDSDAIGWSRVARLTACKFCTMLAGRRTLYRSESSARFAAHTSCHCAARAEFRGGDHGPEANVMQYRASSKRARDDETQERRNRELRKYLNEHYPDARG